MMWCCEAGKKCVRDVGGKAFGLEEGKKAGVVNLIVSFGNIKLQEVEGDLSVVGMVDGKLQGSKGSGCVAASNKVMLEWIR